VAILRNLPRNGHNKVEEKWEHRYIEETVADDFGAEWQVTGWRGSLVLPNALGGCTSFGVPLKPKPWLMFAFVFLAYRAH
jgi:hypothetical protein